MLDQFSATIEKIYAAAVDPNLWEDALRAIETYTGSTGAVLNMVPKTPSALPVCLAGSFSRDDCAEYATNYMWRCPRIAFGEAHSELPIHYDQMILSEREMDRDPTYEWFGSHGLRYYVAGWIGESSDHRAYMSLQRSRRQGHVEPKQVAQFSLIVRHMANALALAVKLGTLEQQARFGLAYLDRVPHAVFALDESGKLLLANARGDALLERGDGLALFNGRLQCRVTSRQAALDRLVQAALGRADGEPQGGWVRVHRATGQRPYIALVARLAGSENPFGSFEPKALVVVGNPADPALLDEQAMRDLFDLTETEARVARALSSGHSIDSAAAWLDIQPSTARAHLKHIFAKTGINRQQDLVRLLSSISSMGL